MKWIAILGTGPAGMMAAHACALAGRPFSLFSLPGKDGHVHPSRIGGAQFIHKPVPMLVDEDTPDFTVRYELRGTEAGYRSKVYGTNPHVPFVSFSHLQDGEEQPAWNLRTIYNAMWESIAGDGSSVNVERVTGSMLKQWVEDDMWEFVVSTVPLLSICLAHEGLTPVPHAFISQNVSLLNKDYANVPENTIVYNGEQWPSWYRASNLQGFQSAEWSDHCQLPKFEAGKMIHVSKPIAHNCTCWTNDPKVILAGRFGKWQKGVLVHDGFTTTAQALMERSML